MDGRTPVGDCFDEPRGSAAEGGFERRTEESRVTQFVRTLPADLRVLEVKRVENAGRQFLELRLESQAF